MFDLVCGMAVLIAVAPVTIVLMVMVRCTRSGPIFLSQDVVGVGGRTFKKWFWAVPEGNQLAWTERFFACELSLVPALINVLAGEMSLVGPSARTPQQHSMLANFAPRHRRLLEARPGLMGVAGDTHRTFGISRQIRLELNYVDNWRFRADLAVVARCAITYPLQNSGLEQ